MRRHLFPALQLPRPPGSQPDRDAALAAAPIATPLLALPEITLPEIVALVRGRPERFILFCDDLSFEAGEAGYTALKSVLDGSVSAVPDNVLIYATSNRRHLMPEYFSENG